MRTSYFTKSIFFLSGVLFLSSCASFRPGAIDFPELETRSKLYEAGGIKAAVYPIHPDTADIYFDEEDFYALPYRAYLLQVDNQSEESLNYRAYDVSGHTPPNMVYKDTRRSAIQVLSTDIAGSIFIGYIVGFTPEVAIPLGAVSLGHFIHTLVINNKRKKYLEAIAPAITTIPSKEYRELVLFVDSTTRTPGSLPLLTPSGKKHEIPVPEHPYQQRNIMINATKGIIVRPDETYEEVAKAYGMTKEELFSFNDFKDESAPTISTGDTLYIVPKRLKARALSHEVASGETMQEISHQYAIDLEQLYYLNSMKEGQEPKAGELILMKGRPRAKPPVLRQ